MLSNIALEITHGTIYRQPVYLDLIVTYCLFY